MEEERGLHEAGADVRDRGGDVEREQAHPASQPCGAGAVNPDACRVRVVLADAPAYTPPCDRSLAAALARTGGEVELVTSRFRRPGRGPGGLLRRGVVLSALLRMACVRIAGSIPRTTFEGARAGGLDHGLHPTSGSDDTGGDLVGLAVQLCSRQRSTGIALVEPGLVGRARRASVGVIAATAARARRQRLAWQASRVRQIVTLHSHHASTQPASSGASILGHRDATDDVAFALSESPLSSLAPSSRFAGEAGQPADAADSEVDEPDRGDREGLAERDRQAGSECDSGRGTKAIARRDHGDELKWVG